MRAAAGAIPGIESARIRRPPRRRMAGESEGEWVKGGRAQEGRAQGRGAPGSITACLQSEAARTFCVRQHDATGTVARGTFELSIASRRPLLEMRRRGPKCVGGTTLDSRISLAKEAAALMRCGTSAMLPSCCPSNASPLHPSSSLPSPRLLHAHAPLPALAPYSRVCSPRIAQSVSPSVFVSPPSHSAIPHSGHGDRRYREALGASARADEEAQCGCVQSVAGQ